MHMLGEFWKPRDRIDEIIAKPDGVRRSKAQTFETIDCADCSEELDERAFAVAAVYHRRFTVRDILSAVIDRRYSGKFVTAIQVHDLTEQGYFLDPSGDESANFRDDFGNDATALGAARPWHNAKSAMHIASLHDRDERRRLFRRERLITNGRLRTDFFFHIDCGKTQIVHSTAAGIRDEGYRTFSRKQGVYVIGHTVKLLGANHKIEMWDLFQQLRAPRLRHAAQKSKDGFRPAFCQVTKHSHFAQRLLLSHVTHATGIE